MFVIKASHKYHKPYPFAWIFIFIELNIAFPALLHAFWGVFLWKKRERPQLRLVGAGVPTVDVLITCAGEDTDVVLDTVRAACVQDYPAGKFRVIVTDDRPRGTLRQDVEALASTTYPHLYYRTRTDEEGPRLHAKAGNLNFAVAKLDNLEPTRGAGEYIAALDADMIAQPHWLRAVLPHLVQDNSMALACPPQVSISVVIP